MKRLLLILCLCALMATGCGEAETVSEDQVAAATLLAVPPTEVPTWTPRPATVAPATLVPAVTATPEGYPMIPTTAVSDSAAVAIADDTLASNTAYPEPVAEPPAADAKGPDRDASFVADGAGITQLVMGLMGLEETELAITAEQAAQMVPIIESLPQTDDVSAQEEWVASIQALLTADQSAALAVTSENAMPAGRGGGKPDDGDTAERPTRSATDGEDRAGPPEDMAAGRDNTAMIERLLELCQERASES